MTRIRVTVETDDAKYTDLFTSHGPNLDNEYADFGDLIAARVRDTVAEILEPRDALTKFESTPGLVDAEITPAERTVLMQYRQAVAKAGRPEGELVAAVGVSVKATRDAERLADEFGVSDDTRADWVRQAEQVPYAGGQDEAL